MEPKTSLQKKKEEKMKKLFSLFYISLLISVWSTIEISGQIWEADTRLTFNDSLSYFSYPTQWAINTDNDNRVHIVWYDLRDPQFASEVYYKRSTDNGATWEPEIPLTIGSNYWQEMPCIVSDKWGRLHVVYTEYVYFKSRFTPIIHYKRSTDGGNTWQPPVDIATVQGDFATHTSLTSDLNNGIYVLFCDQTGISYYEMDNFVIHSTNGGNTWSSPYQLTGSKTALWGSIAADTLGRVHIVYVEAPTGQRHLFYRRSTDMGQTFEPAVQLTTANSNKFNGSIYTDRGNKLHVAWQDNRDGNLEIYYLRSENGGSTWGGEARLTNDSHSSVEPNITADLNDGVYLVWTDEQTDQGVYFKSSQDGGQTWSTDTCLTSGAVAQYDQFFPNIACNDSGTYLHVAWQDMRDGNLEVYYKRRTPEEGILEGITKSSNCTEMKIFPNPFREEVEIRLGMYDVGCAMYDTSLKIYDVGGRLVRDLSFGISYLALGTTVTWDGKDNGDKQVKAGIYFLKIKGYESVKVVKLR